MISLLTKKRQQPLVVLIAQKKIYINYVFTDLSAQIMTTQYDGQNSGS